MHISISSQKVFCESLQKYFVINYKTLLFLKTRDHAITTFNEVMNMSPVISESMNTIDGRALSAALNNDSDPELRIHTAKMIGIARNPSTVSDLIGRLLDPDENVRSEIYLALNRLGTPAEVALIKAFSDATNPALQISAARALGEFGSKTAIPELCKALKSENSEVRINTIWALENIGIQTSEVCDELIRALDDTNSDIVIAAIHAIGSLRCTEAAPRLIANLETANVDFQHEAIQTLGKLGSTHAVLPLLHLLQTTEDRHLPYTILDALGEIKDPIALEPLVALFKRHCNNFEPEGGYFKDYHYLKRVIAKYEGSAVQPLINVMLDEAVNFTVPVKPERWDMEYPPIIHHIADIFERIQSPAVDPLLGLLKNNNPLVRKWVCHCLKRIYDKTAMRSLISVVVNDPSGEVRKQASCALRRYRSIEVYDLLINEIQKSTSSTLEDAKWVLMNIGEYHAGNISDCLLDNDTTRRTAADAIYRNMIHFSTSFPPDQIPDSGRYRRPSRLRRHRF